MRSLPSATLTAALLLATAAGCGDSEATPDAAPDSGALPTPDAGEPGLLDLAPTLEPLRAQHDLPSLAGAVVRGGELVALGATGTRVRGEDIPVTANDRYHLGSCTKAMTATLVALAVEDGLLAWDTTMAEAFPAVDVDPGYASITISALLSHSGGAPGDIDLLPWLDRTDPLPAQRRDFAAEVLASPPGAVAGEFTYSNAGYMIVGAILEARTGLAWEALMEQRLFAPLGMSSCGFGAPGTAGQTDEPWGHQGTTPIPPGPASDNPPVLGPAGTVHCALADWARFAALHLAGARGESDFLSADSFAHLQTPLPDADPPYAAGWLSIDTVFGPAIWHNGSNTIWFAQIAIVPDQNLALLSATNSGAAGAEPATAAALEAIGRAAD
jgi:CubicO group peptidase (beta-lactamase class C family)